MEPAVNDESVISSSRTIDVADCGVKAGHSGTVDNCDTNEHEKVSFEPGTVPMNQLLEYVIYIIT